MMGGGSKINTINDTDGSSRFAVRNSDPQSLARFLHKADLGGVIFCCKDSTIEECLAKQIFGLPGQHISYVRTIQPGLPLFLFNYSNRMLHGVYESASPGQMNIDPYAWTMDGKEKTAFPAQVRICIRTYCRPVPEKRFKPMIEANYHSSKHFYFELDHKQVKDLISLFTPIPQVRNVGLPPMRNVLKTLPKDKEMSGLTNGILHLNELTNSTELTAHASSYDCFAWEDDDVREIVYTGDYKVNDTFSNGEDGIGVAMHTGEIPPVRNELCSDIMHLNSLNDNNLKSELLEDESSNSTVVDKERILDKLKKIVNHASIDSIPSGVCSDESLISSMKNASDLRENQKEGMGEKSVPANDLLPEDPDLRLVVNELRARTTLMENKMIETERELDQLKKRVKELETKQVDPSISFLKESENETSHEISLGYENKSIYLIGGYNGESCLDSVDSYSPSLDILTPVMRMNCPRSFAAATTLNDCIYVFGGGREGNDQWYKTVECYNVSSGELTLCPSLAQENGSLAGATLNGKIFAIGGSNGNECFSNVEVFDPVLGKWIYAQSMLQKRFALAASELNGVLYAVGGYDGIDYLNSAERYDPRESTWTQLSSMNTRRGCHSLAVLNEKIHVMGGYDGKQMVSSMEIFDPRAGSWLTGDSMNNMRGYAAAAVLGGSIFMIGGVEDMESTVDTVECYQEAEGWVATGLKATGTRSFSCAVVM